MCFVHLTLTLTSCHQQTSVCVCRSMHTTILFCKMSYMLCHFSTCFSNKFPFKNENKYSSLKNFSNYFSQNDVFGILCFRDFNLWDYGVRDHALLGYGPNSSVWCVWIWYIKLSLIIGRILPSADPISNFNDLEKLNLTSGHVTRVQLAGPPLEQQL